MRNSLSDEERKEIIDVPPSPWKEWFLTEGSKTWIAVGLLILDIFVYGALWLSSWAYAHYLIPPALIAALYLNYVLWTYLWSVPDIDELRKGRLKHTLAHPFPVGRWTPEYKVWKEQGDAGLHSGALNPDEFV
jgi:hypothetical protein